MSAWNCVCRIINHYNTTKIMIGPPSIMLTTGCCFRAPHSFNWIHSSCQSLSPEIAICHEHKHWISKISDWYPPSNPDEKLSFLYAILFSSIYYDEQGFGLREDFHGSSLPTHCNIDQYMTILAYSWYVQYIIIYF